MTYQPDGQDDLTSGIFGDAEYLRPQTESKEFKPWHRPRKQFVRRKQWSELLQRLFEERDPQEPLRYLGLPGTDLIDLRYLYQEICLAIGRPMCFLGFNTEAQPGKPAHDQLNISLDEVRRLPNVVPQSDVIPDDFRLIGNPKSIAWSRTQQLGPFDVVNIDLCDGVASDPPQNNETVYKALARLVAFQVRNPKPWLLLVTTRIGRDMFDKDAERQIIELFRRNVETCEGFAEACEHHLELDVKSIDHLTCNEADLLKLMTVAVGKWLSALVQYNAPSRVELASTHGYRVEPDATSEDLVSLALRIEPVIMPTPNALSPTPPELGIECTAAKAIVRRSASRLNVDTILEEDADLHEELISETERLLKDARYQTTDYRKWLTS